MATTHAASTPATSKSLILPYLLVLLAAVAALQIFIAVQDITPVAAIGLFVIAAAIFIWHWGNRKALNKVRFGNAVTHAMAYVVVNASFALHAMLGGAFTVGAPEPGWVASAIAMPAFWGIGLVVHLFGATLGGGWED